MKCRSLKPAAAESIQNMPRHPVRSQRSTRFRSPIHRGADRRWGRSTGPKRKPIASPAEAVAEIPRRAGIYRIVCKVDGRCYVGSAVDLLERRTQHWRALRQGKHHNKYLQRAWRRYREINFDFEVLELVRPSRLLAAEQSWLDRTRCVDRRIGFNVHARAFAAGRFGAQTWEGYFDPQGRPVTITNLQKFCRLNGLSNTAMAQLFKGRSKLKSHKGWTNENSVRIRDYAKTYEGFVRPGGKPFGKITNLAAFSRRHDLHPTTMGAVAAGKIINHRGWTYKGGRKRIMPMKHTGFIRPDGRPTVIINLARFCRENGLSTVHMHNLRSGIRKIHKGWTWRMK